MATDMFSTLSAQFRSHNIPLPKVPSALRNPTLTTAAAAVAIGIISLPALIARAARSYRGYLALGPGGMPYNVLGWTLQGLLQPFAWRDTRDPAKSIADPARQGPYEPHGRRTFLAGEEEEGGGRDEGGSPAPAPRRGGRPVVPAYVAPQRQVTQQGSGETRARMLAYLEGLAALNAGLLAQKGSGLEGAGTPALWLDGGGGAGGEEGKEGVALPSYLRSFGGELVHVHPEASSHITVSPADAEALVRRGWAESHRLSGVWNVVPLSYVLVYAPRDGAELEFWKRVVRAGIRFVCAGLDREAVFE